MYRGLEARGYEAAGTAVARYAPRPAGMDIEFAQRTDCGRVREENEDYFGYVRPVNPEEARARGWLFAVADGVGGHDFGEVAARIAIGSLMSGFSAAPQAEQHASLLPALIRKANLRVLEAARAHPGGSVMATTIVACALRHDRAVVAHVGDSRCYLIRHGEASLLTRDHTVAWDQVRLGTLSSQEAEAAPTRHVLSRALGSDLTVNVEVNEHQVLAGDVLVLCSDGLHGSVTAPEMAAVTSRSADLQTAAQSLVDLANQRDGSDNITLQIVRVRSVERVGMYRGRPYRLP
jgi:PPM family protein phosphatase